MKMDFTLPEDVIVGCNADDMETLKKKMDVINRELQSVWGILSGRAMSRSSSGSSDYASSEVPPCLLHVLG